MKQPEMSPSKTAAILNKLPAREALVSFVALAALAACGPNSEKESPRPSVVTATTQSHEPEQPDEEVREFSASIEQEQAHFSGTFTFEKIEDTGDEVISTIILYSLSPIEITDIKKIGLSESDSIEEIKSADFDKYSVGTDADYEDIKAWVVSNRRDKVVFKFEGMSEQEVNYSISTATAPIEQ